MHADGTGMLITKPFVYSGESLYVNVDAGDGRCRAALIDGWTLKPLEEYGLDDCDVIDNDSLRTPLRWKSEQPTSRFVRLRIELTRADLYSFWMEN
jgi:hypothetical protein